MKCHVRYLLTRNYFSIRATFQSEWALWYEEHIGVLEMIVFHFSMQEEDDVELKTYGQLVDHCVTYAQSSYSY